VRGNQLTTPALSSCFATIFEPLYRAEMWSGGLEFRNTFCALYSVEMRALWMASGIRFLATAQA
jgi:hypothetical protein